MKEKLLANGYNLWDKAEGKERIYINDFEKYLDVEVLEGGLGRNRIVNGIDTTEYRASSQRAVLNLIDGSLKFNGLKFYYDCAKEDFVLQNSPAQIINKIFDTIVEKIKNL